MLCVFDALRVAPRRALLLIASAAARALRTTAAVRPGGDAGRIYRSPSLPGVARWALAAVMALAVAAAAQLTPARAAGPGTDRLLVSEMAALKAGVTGLPGAVAKKDFAAAQRHLKNIDRNWPAVRAELDRRGESGAIASFESSAESVAAALEANDGAAASGQSAALRGALDSVSSALESPEVSGRRIVAALVLPLMVIAAVTVSLPVLARKVKVRL